MRPWSGTIHQSVPARDVRAFFAQIVAGSTADTALDLAESAANRAPESVAVTGCLLLTADEVSDRKDNDEKDEKDEKAAHLAPPKASVIVVPI